MQGSITEIKKNQKVIEKFLSDLELKLVHVHVNNYGTINNEGIPSIWSYVMSFISDNLNNDKIYPVVNLDKPPEPLLKLYLIKLPSILALLYPICLFIKIILKIKK